MLAVLGLAVFVALLRRKERPLGCDEIRSCCRPGAPSLVSMRDNTLLDHQTEALTHLDVDAGGLT